MPSMMHRRLLRNQKGLWYARDLGAPLAAVIVVATAWKLSCPPPQSQLAMIVNIVSFSFLSLAAATFAATAIRTVVWGKINNAFKYE
jgi:hypothetical protein